MCEAGLELALERWATVSIRWNDLSTGYRPYLPAFLAGWFSRVTKLSKPENKGKFRESFMVGWDEAEAQLKIINREESEKPNDN